MTAPLGYDEAYNLQVPLHLIADGSYATDGAVYEVQPREFDVLITTGPTVLLPIAGLFKVLGSSLEVARLVGLAYFCALAVCTWLLASRSAGRWAGLLSVALLVAVDPTVDWPKTIVMGPTDVLGEYPCAAFITFSALLLRKKTFLAGICLGAAIATKFIAVLCLPAFVLAICIGSDRWSRRFKHATVLGLGTLVPLIAWTTAKYVAMGPSLFHERSVEFLMFLEGGGSGLPGTGTRVGAPWSDVVGAGLAPLAILSVTGLLIMTRDARRRTRSVLADPGLVALSLTAATWFVWWGGLSARGFVRHLLIAILICCAPLAAGAVNSLRGLSRPRRHVAGAAIVCATCVGLGFALYEGLNRTGLTLDQQRQVAGALAASNASQIRFREMKVQPAEMSFLARLPARSTPLDGDILVAGPLEREIDVETYEATIAACGQRWFDRYGYLICWPKSQLPID